MQLTADAERQPDRLTDWEAALLEEPAPADPAEALDRAKRRAKSCVRDIGLSNDWAWFVTLTLDPAKIDRYDMTAITRKLNSWLDNHVRRDGLASVLVPERHKDGAVHFHGFFNGALKAVDSGTVSVPGSKRPRRPKSLTERETWLARGGHAVFNLPQWTLGFTTAIALYGERRAAVSYVCKYLTKAQEKVGGRWYYSGGALRKPEVSYADVNLEDLAAAPGACAFGVPQLLGIQFVQLTVQETCNVNQHGEGGEKMPRYYSQTDSSLQFEDCQPEAGNEVYAVPSVVEPEENDAYKMGGSGKKHDNGIPAESTSGACLGGADTAKPAHHSDGFTDGLENKRRFGVVE